MRYEKYDAKADLWSVGAIMYEMLYGGPPYRAPNHIQLTRLIETTPPPRLAPTLEVKLPSGEVQRRRVGEECRTLLASLLKKNPLERISFEEFFTHPYIASPEGSAVAPPSSTSVPCSSRQDVPRARRVNSQPSIDTTGLQSIASLGSSVSSLPPFARLSVKYGTPPSRASGSFKSGTATVAG